MVGLSLPAAEILFVILTGFLAVLYTYQARMIFPGSATQGRPEAEVIAHPGTELVSLTTSQGDRVVAVFGPALTDRGDPRHDAAERPTLLYFYGNGYNLRDAVASDFEPFRRLGFNVMIPDYVGYGMSGGKPSEQGCYATADAAYEHLLGREDVDPAHLVVAGRSLGGAVAIDLAAQRKVAGLVAFCTFTRMREMASRQLPYVPVSLLLKHRFESLSKIPEVTCPILLGHGEDDDFVPPAMADSLAAAAKVPVRVFKVAGANHTNFYEVGREQVLRELSEFVESLPKTDF